ncbi:MAG: alpha/beta fold hydrolase [Candidatus Neomarinimicrobiota bacterium]
MEKKFIFFLYPFFLYANYSSSGPHEVVISGDNYTLSNGQSIEYRLYNPANIDHTAQVAFVHGFSRNMDSYHELAEHYASWGLGVITLNLLYSSIFDNDPLQDAIDLRDVSDYFSDGRPVIYVGHSAGAMRAIVAATEDTNAIAILGLDLTDGAYEDSGGEFLGLMHANMLSIPVWGLLGESSSCNAYGNGLNVYLEAENGNAISISEADHCDFEFPTNFVCTLLCQEENETFQEDDIKTIILNLSTSYLLYHSGYVADINLFWTPGNYYYDDLIGEGAIEQLTELNIKNKEYVPNNIILHSNYPNPFNPFTKISYKIMEESFISIQIKDIRGRHIITLTDRYHSKGNHIISWDGTNSGGNQQTSGVYFYTINNENYSAKGKMILLK